MGILPMHVPVLTALSPGELRIGYRAYVDAHVLRLHRR